MDSLHRGDPPLQFAPNATLATIAPSPARGSPRETATDVSSPVWRLQPLLRRAANAPVIARLLTAARPEKSRQLVKVGQLVRHFEGEWKILKSRRFHAEGMEYALDLVMMHQSHGIALISVCPPEYTLPDLATEVVRRILRQSGFSAASLAGIPIVFVSAYERSMQEVADELQSAFASLPVTTAGRWEGYANKSLSSAIYDRRSDDFGVEIINPSSASPAERRAVPVPRALPDPMIIYIACSSIGAVAGIAITATILLL